MNEIEKYDVNMRPKAIVSSKKLAFYDPMKPPFSIKGFGWFDVEHKYFRMPIECKNEVTEGVYWLASNTSGGQIRFATNSKEITLRVKLNAPGNMIHMPSTGQCGFDLYYKYKNKNSYNFFTVAKYPYGSCEYEANLFISDHKKYKDIIINFPLYMGVSEVLVGLDKNAKLYPMEPFASNGKVLVYGTSITQGGCASRPGMSYTNLLSKMLNLEFINLGFSGCGNGEPNMAKIITTLDDLSLIILDYDANGGTNGILMAHMEEFITILRKKFKDTPILVLTKPYFTSQITLRKENEMRKVNKEFQENLVNNFIKSNDKNIYYQDGTNLTKTAMGHEAMVDGIHPSDLGFYCYAKKLYPIIKNILNKSK